jgi:hypothetical protein
MNCETIDDLLLDLLYEEVEGDTKIKAEAHLSTCEGCQQKLAGMGSVRRSFQAMPEPEMPQLGYQALLAEATATAKTFTQPAIAKNKEEGIWAKLSAAMRVLLSPPVAVAAGLVLVVTVSLSINEKAPSAPSFDQSKAVFSESPTVTALDPEAPRAAPSAQAASAPITEKQPAGDAGPAMESGYALDKKAEAAPPKIELKPVAQPTIALAPTAAKSKKDVAEISSPKPTEPPSDDLLGGTMAPPMANTATGGSNTKEVPADPILYEQSIKNGNSAYKRGDLVEAEEQYQIAADNAPSGSKDQDVALAAQVQAQSSGKDCDSALSSARRITETSKDVALLAVADCYAASGNTAKAKELYAEISAMNGIASAEAKRNLVSLETKLSKPSLEPTKAAKDATKNQSNTNKKKK